MAFWLTGIDEAGYGPLLGPLTVGMVTVESPEPISAAAPWKLLSPVVVHHSRRRRKGPAGVAVADSKKLHRPATGDLTPLETGVLAFLAAERGGEPPGTFRELVDHLTGGRGGYLDEYPWYQDGDFDLPVSVPRLELIGAIRRLQRRLDGSGLRVTELRTLPLEVREFNDNVKRRDSKGEVNAWAVGRLLRWIWRQKERTEAEAYIDRLGGRNRYGSLLFPLFEGARFNIVEQEDKHQEYKVEDDDGRSLVIHFQKEAEASSFSTALASMTAKYLRELHMHLFNRWWHGHAPDIRRTAGYTEDARRFLSETASLRRELGIDDALLIRQR